MRHIDKAGYLAHAYTTAFERRLEESRRVITDTLAKCVKPYIAFSTGKDSLCVMHLVWEQAPNTPAVYLDADCALPETTELLVRLEQANRPIVRWTCKPFLDILRDAGGPAAHGVEDATMRETVYKPVRELLDSERYDAVFLGLRREESNGRRMLIYTRGLAFDNKRDGTYECLPIGWWSFRDVWAYIVSRDLDYNRAYDKQEELPVRNRRLSYWAGESERQNGRWVWLRQTYPDLWNRYVQHFPEVARFT